MTLDRYGRLLQWAYFLEDSIPDRTSLCPLFWRCVLLTPIKAAFMAFAVVFVLVVAPGLILYWLMTLTAWFPAVVLGPLALAAVGLIVYAHVLHRAGTDHHDLIERMAEAPLVQGALAIKRGVCPIVELVDGERS